MEANKYRDLVSLLNQYLQRSYQGVLDSLSFTLSIYQAFKDKDSLPEDQRLNEESEDAVYNSQEMLNPLISELKPHSSLLNQLALETGILPAALVEDINMVLEYKEEGDNLATSAFSPYTTDKEDQKDAMDEFLYRLVMAHRVKSWVKEIGDGILQYGAESYQVPLDDKPDGINILEGLEEMNTKQLFQELPDYLIPDADDSDETQSDKSYEAYLLKKLLPYYKEDK